MLLLGSLSELLSRSSKYDLLCRALRDDEDEGLEGAGHVAGGAQDDLPEELRDPRGVLPASTTNSLQSWSWAASNTFKLCSFACSS